MFGLALGLAGILPRFKLPEPDMLGAGGGQAAAAVYPWRSSLARRCGRC